MSKIITVLAGEFVHKTTTQFRALAARAPSSYSFRIIEDASALDRLADAALFIAAGLHWTGSPTVTWTSPAPYVGATEAQKSAFRAYVAGGRPVMGYHGGVASFDDWPEFGQLLGFAWHWDITTHGPLKEYRVFPFGPPHPVLAGVEEFRVFDENYHGIQLRPGRKYANHLRMDCGDVHLPMLLTSEGGPRDGAGRSAYLALGHDRRSSDHPAVDRLFWNTVAWLLGETG